MCSAVRLARSGRRALPLAATVRSTCAKQSRQARLQIRQSRRAEAKSFVLTFAQAITEATNRFNRVTRFAELFTQAAHVCIHRAGVDDTFVPPNPVKQPIAFLHAASALH